MKRKFTLLLVVVILFLVQNISFGQQPPPLGTTAGFAIFTRVGAINNDGASLITGDVGTNVGPVNGLGLAYSPGKVVGTFHVIDPVSVTAAIDVGVAYGYLAAMTADVIGIELGGQTLLPGVHGTGAASTLTGTLTLDGLNDPNSLFVIKIDGDLAAAADSKVELINLANVCNVYWQINGKLDLATYSALQGTVITSGAINLYVGSSVLGRVLSTSGAVNMHTTEVTLPACGCLVSAPTLGTITQPTCLVATGSVLLTDLPAGEWTINPGAITGNTESTTISGLAAGTYNFTVTNECATSEPSADVVINAQPLTSAAPTVGTITQPTCAVGTGSVVLNGLPEGYLFINPGAIAGTGTSITISDLVAGTYNFTVTNAEGCISAPSADVVITAIVATPIVTVVQATTCITPLGSITVTAPTGTGMTYSIDGTDYTNADGIFTAVPPGTYTVTAKDADGCISAVTSVTIILPVTPAVPTVGTITQPTCLVTTGSVVLSGLPAGEWTINPGAITGSTESTTISGLAAGTHNFTVTNICATSAQSADVVIDAQPDAPAAPTVGTITQPICGVAAGNVVLSGLPAGNWTINPGGITGHTTTKTIFGLTTGTYNFTVTDALGCTSAASADVVLSPLHVPHAAPTVGTITQPTCEVPTGSVVLNGLPDGVTWYIHPSDNTSLVVGTGTGTSTTISGLDPGTHNYTVVSEEVCWDYSAPSADVVIIAIVETPVVTVVQPTTCETPLGSITVTAPTGIGMTYSINGTDYNTDGIFTAVAPGTYSVTAKDAAGCISAVTSVIIHTLVYEAPAVGTITQPTCAVGTGSVVLNGLPDGVTWYIHSSDNPLLIAGTGTGTSTTISGLAPGTYYYTVTSAEVCYNYSAPSAAVVITAIVATPTVTVTQPTTCETPLGTITVTAPTGIGMTYSIDGTDYTNTDGIFTAVAPGTYSVTAKDAAGCISAVTSVTINAQPSTVVTLIQPTLTEANGTITVTAPTGTGMGYSIDGTDYTNTSGIFTVPAGTYTVTSRSADLCISLGISVTINAQPVAPAAPTVTVTQPTETVATGTITITAPTGTGMTYSINGVDYNNTNGIFACLAPGTYTVTARDANGYVSSVTTVTIIDYVTAIEKIGDDSKFDIYPVPNNGQFTVVIFTQTEKHFDILISNAKGSKIYEEKNIVVNGKLEHNIDLTQAQKGMYYVMLRSKNDQVTRKIIISK